MDGDIAPIPELCEIAKRYGALLLIDDAHATGVLGQNGSGSLSHYGIPWEEHIILMGTLSKAIGCQGGFVCATKSVIEYLINYCRSFIYSTGISPWIAAMAHFNVSRIRTDSEPLTRLRKATAAMKESLGELGIDTGNHLTPILPILLGDSERANLCAEALFQKNIVAAAIRPPTVPDGTARIRVSVSAAHRISDLKKAASTMVEILSSKRS